MQDVVQNIEVGLQIHYLSICRITIKIHVLVLLHSHILILSKLRSSAVVFTQTKKARESDEIHLVVLALRGPMDDVNGIDRVSLVVIGSIKLSDDFIVPMLPKFHQVGKPHFAQIMNQLHQLWLLE